MRFSGRQTLIILIVRFWRFASINHILIKHFVLIAWFWELRLLKILIERRLILQFERINMKILWGLFAQWFLIASLWYITCDLFGNWVLIRLFFVWYLFIAFSSLLVYIIKGVHVRDLIRLIQRGIVILNIFIWIYHSNLLYELFCFFKFLDINHIIAFQFVL